MKKQNPSRNLRILQKTDGWMFAPYKQFGLDNNYNKSFVFKN